MKGCRLLCSVLLLLVAVTATVSSEPLRLKSKQKPAAIRVREASEVAEEDAPVHDETFVDGDTVITVGKRGQGPQTFVAKAPEPERGNSTASIGKPVAETAVDDEGKAKPKPQKPSHKPSKPSKPSQKPQKPSRPSKPAGKPSKPGKPSGRPQKPSKPGQKPSKPSRPNKPSGKPQKPGKPSKPSKPSNKPSRPSKPSNKPSKPSRPMRPAGGKPAKPARPYEEEFVAETTTVVPNSDSDPAAAGETTTLASGSLVDFDLDAGAGTTFAAVFEEVTTQFPEPAPAEEVVIVVDDPQQDEVVVLRQDEVNENEVVVPQDEEVAVAPVAVAVEAAPAPDVAVEVKEIILVPQVPIKADHDAAVPGDDSELPLPFLLKKHKIGQKVDGRTPDAAVPEGRTSTEVQS